MQVGRVERYVVWFIGLNYNLNLFLLQCFFLQSFEFLFKSINQTGHMLNSMYFVHSPPQVPVAYHRKRLLLPWEWAMLAGRQLLPW